MKCSLPVMTGLTLLLGVTACRGAPVAGAPIPPCPAPTVDQSGWKSVDAGPFSMSLPADYQSVPVQGIDSRVGRYAPPGEEEVVAFDYGRYSSDLRYVESVMLHYESCTEEIGGRRALLVTYELRDPGPAEEGRSFFAGATWRDVEPGIHLSVSTSTRDAGSLPRMLAILRSVRFSGGAGR